MDMSLFTELNQPLKLTSEHKSFYEKYRYIKLKGVFGPEIIAAFNKIISNKVAEMNREDRPIEDRDTYGKAFLQLFNLWRTDDDIKKLVLCRRLGQIASELMRVDGVRLYHDQALFKEAGGGITPWHADQYYWPLETDKTVTAWIPLQSTALEMGPLEFSAGSHCIQDGRNLSISDQSEEYMEKRLRVTDFEHIVEPFDLGEVSFHSGWVFHRAGANTTKDTRKVMTIIYMDKDMRLKKPENDGQLNDWKTWCPGTKVGEVIQSYLNPMIYESIGI